MSTAPKLELRGVRKDFSGAAVVADLTFSIAEGEFVSLLGPSGCGKSTTLSMVAGFLEPDVGDILIDGRRVNDVATRHRGVGIVFQDYAVFTRLSVRENLAFGLEARRVPRREVRVAVDEMAEKLELAALLDRRAGTLNLSEMQRLAIGRALVPKPGLLLLDEPMANLDAAIRTTLRSELKRIQASLGQTVLYVTHDQVEAMAMSDRILVMDRGRLLQAGPPEEVHDAPCSRFVAEFIGDPPIDVLPCTVAPDRPEVAVLADGLDVPIAGAGLPARDYLLAVRPHHVHLAVQPADGHAAAKVRFVENLGAEHVLHLAFGGDFVRVLAAPGTARPGDTVHWRPDAAHVHVIDRGTGAVVFSAGRASAP